MNIETVESVIRGNIEALDQGIELIESLSDSQYVHVATPFVSSSIGQHFRHLVDLFFSVVKGSECARVDYDNRRRGAEIETSRAVALSELNEIRDWMLDLAVKPNLVELGSKPIELVSEVTLTDTASVTMPTTLARELIFTSSHAVHHFAIVNIVAKMQGVKTSKALGIAPATASFIRDEQKQEEDATV